MNSLIVYEISGNRESELVNAMKKIGYFSQWIRGGTTELYNLPQHCLWKQNIELKSAKAEIIKVIEELNRNSPSTAEKIELKRCIVLSVDPWEGITGTPY